MGHLDPIAYVYDADVHCEGCARQMFEGTRWPGFIENVTKQEAEKYEEEGFGLASRARMGRWNVELTDMEGNPVGAVAPWDEWASGYEEGCENLTCGTCLGTIDSVHDDEAEECECHAW